jgi:hypothetical protein
LELSETAKQKLKTSLKVAKKLEKMEMSRLSDQDADDLNFSSSEPASLEPYIDPSDATAAANLNTIDNLEAIIDGIIQDNNHHHHTQSNNNNNNNEFQPIVADAACQTHSTGDIVVMKVFEEK